MVVVVTATFVGPLVGLPLEPGSCDPHGLGFYKGAFIGCDAGHHPGWPDKDGPGVGWVFRIELI